MLEEVSFLSAIGISLPLQHSPPWYARSRIGITLKIAIRAFSDEQVVEKREGIGGRDRDRTGDPLLAKTRRNMYLDGSLGFTLCRSIRFCT